MSGLLERIEFRISILTTLAEAATQGDWEWAETPDGKFHIGVRDWLPSVACDVPEWDLNHILAWNPQAVLRGLAEDRDVLARHTPYRRVSILPDRCEWCSVDAPCHELVSLARRHGIPIDP